MSTDKTKKNDGENYTFRPYTRKLPADVRQFACLRGQKYALDGNISAGKTTLGQSIVEFLRSIGLEATFLPERIPHDLLAQFLEYQKSHPNERNIHAFALQSAFLDCRIETNQEADALARLGHIVFIDRSLVGDYVFARVNYESGGITATEWQSYLAHVKEADQLEPTCIVYVNTSIPVCMERIAARQRSGEVGAYDTTYLQRINDTHFDVLEHVEYPTLILNWDKHQPTIPEDTMRHILQDLVKLLMTPHSRAWVCELWSEST